MLFARKIQLTMRNSIHFEKSKVVELAREVATAQDEAESKRTKLHSITTAEKELRAQAAAAVCFVCLCALAGRRYARLTLCLFHTGNDRRREQSLQRESSACLATS